MTTLDPFDDRTWDEHERLYFREIDLAQERKLNMLISNGKPEHAAYLIDKFFQHAQSDIRLFSGRLSRTLDGVEMYGNPHIRGTAKGLFERGCQVRIVLAEHIDAPNHDPNQHPLVEIANSVEGRGQMKGRLDIRMACRDSTAFLKENRYLHHWMVMDDHAYRLETDTGAVKAHVNFNDGKAADALTSIFDDLLFERGKPLVAVPR